MSDFERTEKCERHPRIRLFNQKVFLIFSALKYLNSQEPGSSVYTITHSTEWQAIGEHGLTSGAYAEILAELCGVNKESIGRIVRAALFHGSCKWDAKTNVPQTSNNLQIIEEKIIQYADALLMTAKPTKITPEMNEEMTSLLGLKIEPDTLPYYLKTLFEQKMKEFDVLAAFLEFMASSSSLNDTESNQVKPDQFECSEIYVFFTLFLDRYFFEIFGTSLVGHVVMR
jgi:hypothetical protein